jgi:AraC-like DNA-binding protein
LIFPKEVAAGYFKVQRLPIGLDLILVDYALNKDICLTRKAILDEQYTVRIEEAQLSGEFVVKIDKDYVRQQSPVRSIVVLTSSLFEFMYLVTKGTKVRSVNVMLTPEWLNHHLPFCPGNDCVQKYLALKTQSLNLEPMDQFYRDGLNDILAISDDDPLRVMKIESRVMEMLERFFTNVNSKVTDVKEVSLTHDEIYKMMEVELQLINSFEKPPTIEQLASKFSIGVSKLKRHFKLVYGLPLYEYFQKHRMQRAKVMLLSGEYSVKEAGYKLGYQNLSNFAHAFKKEFGVLPSKASK